jgi:hypothetical protein
LLLLPCKQTSLGAGRDRGTSPTCCRALIPTPVASKVVLLAVLPFALLVRLQQ